MLCAPHVQVRLFDVKGDSLRLACSFNENIAALFLRRKDDFVLVGDLMRSLTLLLYRPNMNNFEVVIVGDVCVYARAYFFRCNHDPNNGLLTNVMCAPCARYPCMIGLYLYGESNKLELKYCCSNFRVGCKRWMFVLQAFPLLALFVRGAAFSMEFRNPACEWLILPVLPWNNESSEILPFRLSTSIRQVYIQMRLVKSWRGLVDYQLP